MDIKFLGIDIAKNVFQLCGMSRGGKVVLTKRVRRDALMQVIAQIPPCTIAVEACTGAYYWHDRFTEMGHTVKIISPQFVKPFVKGQKNDGNDAEAIAIAVQQPTMRFVPPRSIEQQDIQALHRARQRLVNHRSATVSQIRGLLLERGVPIALSISRVRRAVPEILEDVDNGLNTPLRAAVYELFELVRYLDERVAYFDREIDQIFRRSAVCQRIAQIPGVGPKTATAIMAAAGDGAEFKNGRHFAAWLGLVPRQHSSGDRRVMMGIIKRGDRHLRTLLVHGARAVVRVSKNKTDRFSHWVNSVHERRGHNKAIVAVANKNARIIWTLLRNEQHYQPQAVTSH
jgi:transposase